MVQQNVYPWKKLTTSLICMNKIQQNQYICSSIKSGSLLRWCQVRLAKQHTALQAFWQLHTTHTHTCTIHKQLSEPIGSETQLAAQLFTLFILFAWVNTQTHWQLLNSYTISTASSAKNWPISKFYHIMQIKSWQENTLTNCYSCTAFQPQITM